MIVFRLIGNIRDRQGRGLQCCPLRPPRAGLTVPTRVGQTAVGTVTGAGTEGGSVCSGQLAGWGQTAVSTVTGARTVGGSVCSGQLAGWGEREGVV
jgi:hypothetical protein